MMTLIKTFFIYLIYLSILPNPSISKSNEENTSSSKQRIAILIPFIGNDLPTYFPLFAQSASASSSLIDFWIFHCGIPTHNLPPPDQLSQYPNIKLINLQSIQRFSNLLLRVVEERLENLDLPYNQLLKMLSQHLTHYPYVLVEFKMAMGFLFQNYIMNYSHWGYADLDIMFGDLPRWITPEELEMDLVTYGYGDQHRLYIRGQFTFMKNNDRMNEIWKGCAYLSKLDERFAHVLQGQTKMSFESAEGCFSKVILEQTDIKVKYAVKAMTDIDDTDSMYKYGVYMGRGRNGDESVLYKAGSNDVNGLGLKSLDRNWFEQDGTYIDSEAPLQWELGSRIPIQTYADIDKDDHCMHWVKPQYQSSLCALDVQSDETVFWIDGVLYKQKYANYDFPNSIESFPFFHFQEWKRYYRKSQIQPTLHRNAMGIKDLILTSNGVLPMISKDVELEPEHRAAKQIMRWEQTTFVEDEMELPTSSFCLRSSQRQFPPQPITSECLEQASWQDEDFVEILSHGETWESVNAKTDVTFVMTLELNPSNSDGSNLDGLLKLAETNLKIWGNQQPSIFLIHVAGTTQLLAQSIYEKLEAMVETSSISTDTKNEEGEEIDADPLMNPFSSCLMAVMMSADISLISRKALLNMATAAAPTRFVISGLELERGVMLSNETALFAKRTSLLHEDTTGNVFIIPQFASKTDWKEDGLSTLGIEEFMKQSHLELSPLHQLDCRSCAHSSEDNYYSHTKEDAKKEKNLEQQVNSLWQKITKYDLKIKGGESIRIEERYSLDMYDQLHIDLIHLLNIQNEALLRNYDVNHLLMVDSIGPHDGILTSDIVAEVEELGGLRCFNALRLAKLAVLGYTIQILPGAFSISFPASRKIVYGGDCSPMEDSMGVGLSRCDGCFMMNNHDLLESIISEERKLAAKTSILWNEV